jgi:uncharacterized repeat protein (TIGR01451 family)
MFKKLLSNLAFNPSLIGQVAFYSQRLKREATVRRTGLVILILAVLLQTFAVFSPPQPTLARSNNDLIAGGISSKDQAVSYCNQNVRDYKTIMSYYGISCDDINKATATTIKSTDQGKRLYSMGHLAYGKQGETPVNIPGMSTVYLRYLWSWDSSKASTYKALEGKTSSGLKFYILYDCGNLVFVGLPTPPERCKYDKSLPATDKKCFEACPVPGKSDIPKSSNKCTSPCPYNKSIPAGSTKCFEACRVKGKEKLPKTSEECFIPCEYNSSLNANSPSCKPCENSQTQDDLTACLDYDKTASNISRGISDANNTTALPGETIKYTLTTTNKGKATIKDYVVNENISDVLDYADLIDTGGATKNEENILVWPKSDIKANKTVTFSFTIKVKDPLPATPTSSSDPGHYDQTMTNAYGNTVTIKLPASISKTTEIVTTTQLPNTGPGTSLIIAFAITAFASYLFARTQLMSRELAIVRADFASVGGTA